MYECVYRFGVFYGYGYGMIIAQGTDDPSSLGALKHIIIALVVRTSRFFLLLSFLVRLSTIYTQWRYITTCNLGSLVSYSHYIQYSFFFCYLCNIYGCHLRTVLYEQGDKPEQ